MKPFNILTPSPILGYGYDLAEFWHTVETATPAAIILDAGSTDPGPYMLGTGKTLCSRASYIRDLVPILEACAIYKIKFLVSSAGGAGTNAQVDDLVGIIDELSSKHQYSFNVATIKFSGDTTDWKQYIRSQVKVGATSPCGPGPALTVDALDKVTAMVAQMGAEPFLEVLKDETVDIIIAGRSYDPSPFAAFSIHKGVQDSTAWHMGKIMECGGLCALPKGRSMLATMYEDSFSLTPTNPIERCTSVSVAAHTMYEKTRPDRLPGPGGVLHLGNAVYKELGDGRTVLIHGAEFVPGPKYQVKLEGCEMLGFRTVYIGGIRDPYLISGIDEFLETVRKTTKLAFPDLGIEGGPELIFHIYGKNAVMGALEPTPVAGHEIGLLGEVFAQTQDIANAIAGFSRTVVLHGAYEGQVATAGNFASPLTPLEQPAGPVFKFSVYHLMDMQDPTSLFPISKFQVGSKRSNGSLVGTEDAKISRPKLPELAQLPPLIKKAVPPGLTTLNNVARVIRSKNSGPFEMTLDVLFDDAIHFNRVKESKALAVSVVEKLYNLNEEDVITCMFFEPALGWKCTFKRPWIQGSVGERDTFGAQMHAPLLTIVVPAAN